MHKKAIAAVVSLCLFLLCSCSNQQKLDIPELVQGGYREQVIDSFPDLRYIAGMEQIDDTIYLFGSKEALFFPDIISDHLMSAYEFVSGPWELWYSYDSYQWELINYNWDIDDLYIHSATFDKDGGLYFTYTTDLYNADENLYLAYGNENGWATIAELHDIEDGLIRYDMKFSFADDGCFVITDDSPILLHLDLETGATNTIYSYKSEIGIGTMISPNTISLDDNILSICAEIYLLLYDLQKQEEIQMMLHPLDLTDGKYAFCSSRDTGYYICDPTGLYRIADDGSLTEQLANGAYYNFGIEGQQILRLLQTDNNGFLILTMKNGVYQLSSLTLDQDFYRAPERELHIYSLYDTPVVQELTRSYRQQKPEVLITHRVGVPDESVTVEDALKTLSTELSAGAGPDILVLDGLPHTYSGQMLDLSSLIDEISQTNNLVTGVTGAYTAQQSVYAVPTAFTIPIIVGSGIKDVNSIQELILYITELNEAYPRIPHYDLLDWYYQVASSQWTSEGTMWDEAAIAQGIEQWDRLNDALSAGYRLSNGDLFSQSREFLFDESPFLLVAIGSFEDYAYIAHALRSKESGDVYVFSGDAGGIFLPQTIVSINAASKYPADAGDFIRYILSTEGQKIIAENDSLPVNMDALNEVWLQKDAGSVTIEILISNYGEWVNINILWPFEDEYDRLIRLFEELGTPSANDELLRLYFNDQISVDAG